MMGGTGFFFGGWMMLIFWGVVIAGVIVVFQMVTGHSKRAGQGEKSALDVLAERFARGEISEQEFVRMREQLRQ